MVIGTHKQLMDQKRTLNRSSLLQRCLTQLRAWSEWFFGFWVFLFVFLFRTLRSIRNLDTFLTRGANLGGRGRERELDAVSRNKQRTSWLLERKHFGSSCQGLEGVTNQREAAYLQLHDKPVGNNPDSGDRLSSSILTLLSVSCIGRFISTHNSVSAM